jgi:hypothetical protein
MANCRRLLLVDWQIPDVLHNPNQPDQYPCRNRGREKKQQNNDDRFDQTLHIVPE